MRAPAFDAVLDFPLGAAGLELRAEIVFLGGGVAARFTDHAVAGRKSAPFVRVVASGPVDVKWGDPFEVRTESGAILGRGRCLYPGAPPPDELKASKRKTLLARLELGDSVRVVLVSCDLALRRMSFVPAADTEERRP